MKIKILLALLLSAAALNAQGVGINMHGADITPNAAGTNGGYQHYAPILYNPYDSSVCHDVWGNTVQQPMITGNLSAFTTNDAALWVSASPSMPFTNTGAWSSSTTYTAGQVASVNGVNYAALTTSLNQAPTSSPFPVANTWWMPIYGAVQAVVYDVGQAGNPSTATGPCGAPLPVNLNFGLNTNVYIFARGGLSTDQTFFNSIQTLNGGGFSGNSFTASTFYPAGTTVCTAYNGTSCTSTTTLSSGAYLGGHTDIGSSNGPPASGGIGFVSNPLSGGEGLTPGTSYFDTGAGCGEIYNGSTFNSYGCAGGGVTSFNTRTGAVTLLAADVAAVEQDLRTSATPTFAGVVSTTFNSTATGTTAAFVQNTGVFQINGDGKLFAQSLCTSGNPVTEGCTYGLTSAGVLTVASCTGCGGGVSSFNTRTGAVTLTAADVAAVEQDLRTSATPTFTGVVSTTFNSTATGTTSAVQQNSGNFQINGDGKSFFQGVCTNGTPSTEVCTYGLTSAGVLTVASCTGCSGGVTSVNSFTGAVSISSTGNGISITNASNTVSLSMTQNLTTGGAPTFNGLTVTNTMSAATVSASINLVGTYTNLAGSATINSSGDFGGQAITIGANNGSTATAGAGATINKSGSAVSILAYDSGGVCGIGTGEPSPGVSCSSDARLKTMGISIDDGLTPILQLRPVTYNWLANGLPGVGFIAQEVQSVLPRLVTVGSDPRHLLSLSEDGIIPYLVRAIQQLQAQIDTLRAAH